MQNFIKFYWQSASWEIHVPVGIFLQKLFCIQSQFFNYYACTAFNWVLLVIEKNLRVAGFIASLPFLTYLSNKGLKPLIHCVQLWRKIAQIAWALSKQNDFCVQKQEYDVCTQAITNFGEVVEIRVAHCAQRLWVFIKKNPVEILDWLTDAPCTRQEYNQRISEPLNRLITDNVQDALLRAGHITHEDIAWTFTNTCKNIAGLFFIKQLQLMLHELHKLFIVYVQNGMHEFIVCGS